MRKWGQREGRKDLGRRVDGVVVLGDGLVQGDDHRVNELLVHLASSLGMRQVESDEKDCLEQPIDGED